MQEGKNYILHMFFAKSPVTNVKLTEENFFFNPACHNLFTAREQ